MTELIYVNIFSFFDLLKIELYSYQISLENDKFLLIKVGVLDPPQSSNSQKNSVLIGLRIPKKQQKKADATGELVKINVVAKFTEGVLKNLKKSMTTPEDDISVQPALLSQERYIPSQKRQQIIDEFRML